MTREALLRIRGSALTVERLQVLADQAAGMLDRIQFEIACLKGESFHG